MKRERRIGRDGEEEEIKRDSKRGGRESGNRESGNRESGNREGGTKRWGGQRESTENKWNKLRVVN